MGNSDAVGGLRNLLRRKAPSIVFLCETKLSSSKMKKVWRKFDGYEGMAVDSVGRSGGLAFLWRNDVKCTFRSATVHYMDFDVEVGVRKLRVTGFYGWPSVQDRHLSWRLLSIFAEENDDPWLCFGDYNEILYSTEMMGGRTRAQWQMNNFRDAVDECGLRDIPFEGYKFTFDNGQVGDDNRQSRIDRAMCTEAWSELFPYAKLIHLNREWSDHASIQVILDKRVEEEDKGRSKRFRFEHIWVGEEGCEDTIKKAWNGDDADLMGTIERAVNERKKLVEDIAKLLRQEEMFWRQRSRALWLKDGDKNTKFFHRRASQRKQKNHISKLVDDEGRIHESTETIAATTTNYFKDLFTSTNPIISEELLYGVEGRVTDMMNAGLQANYGADEVIEALNQMNPLKAPGPDGMNGLFFQTYWHIVGHSVIRQVLGILNGAPFPAAFNHIQIVLIPKKKAPDKMVDFRPISLCNVVYKIFSKVLANRLKVFLGDIVSENQSAFTPDRLHG
ncbi:uncharacterized protein LOC141633799 [Silene latifolia]|uniref:uncharacterized protein LOC141633799 n=1 Tax=Silene latifolia TaxID=37657 RepID=UPI003D789F48